MCKVPTHSDARWEELLGDDARLGMMGAFVFKSVFSNDVANNTSQSSYVFSQSAAAR